MHFYATYCLKQVCISIQVANKIIIKGVITLMIRQIVIIILKTFISYAYRRNKKQENKSASSSTLKYCISSALNINCSQLLN